jgi:hypothetical protein
MQLKSINKKSQFMLVTIFLNNIFVSITNFKG